MTVEEVLEWFHDFPPYRHVAAPEPSEDPSSDDCGPRYSSDTHDECKEGSNEGGAACDPDALDAIDAALKVKATVDAEPEVEATVDEEPVPDSESDGADNEGILGRPLNYVWVMPGQAWDYETGCFKQMPMPCFGETLQQWVVGSTHSIEERVPTQAGAEAFTARYAEARQRQERRWNDQEELRLEEAFPERFADPDYYDPFSRNVLAKELLRPHYKDY